MFVAEKTSWTGTKVLNNDYMWHTDCLRCQVDNMEKLIENYVFCQFCGLLATFLL